MTPLRPVRFMQSLLMIAGLALLAACGAGDLKKPPVPLGDFVLGLNIAIADTAQVPGISRQATADEWEAAMKQAMVDRFGRYEGSRIYNFGLNVEGYVLAPPGVPVVASPRSALIVRVFVYEDATQTLLNPGGERLILVEGVSAESFLGSGWTQTKKQQMAKMAYDAALAVQNYLLKHPEWFGLPPIPEAPAAN
jgi:hypothetical protein